MQGHHFRIGDLDIVYSEGTHTRLNKVLGRALLLFAISLYNDDSLYVSFVTSSKQTLKYTLINSFVKAGTISKDSSSWVEEDGSFKYTTRFTNLTDAPTILFVW